MIFRLLCGFAKSGISMKTTQPTVRFIEEVHESICEQRIPCHTLEICARTKGLTCPCGHHNGCGHCPAAIHTVIQCSLTRGILPSYLLSETSLVELEQDPVGRHFTQHSEQHWCQPLAAATAMRKQLFGSEGGTTGTLYHAGHSASDAPYDTAYWSSS